MRTTRADQAARNTGTTRLKRFAADRLRGLVHPLAALLLGLVAGAIAIVAVGGSVAETYAEMWKGAFGSFYYTTNTLARSTPIMLIGSCAEGLKYGIAQGEDRREYALCWCVVRHAA